MQKFKLDDAKVTKLSKMLIKNAQTINGGDGTIPNTGTGLTPKPCDRLTSCGNHSGW